MKNKIEILGIIPARSGSKTIKNKNLIKIKGNPLIFNMFLFGSPFDPPLAGIIHIILFIFLIIKQFIKLNI